MAEQRLDRPYSQFNFRVSWDDLDENSAQAGFQEISGLGMEITVAEYRAGNSATNEPTKITGTVKTPDVTLKRGVVGELETLYNWLNDVRNGAQTALKNVTINLMSEDRETVAQTWRLLNARPKKYTGPTLAAKGGGEVAMEELSLVHEGIEYK